MEYYIAYDKDNNVFYETSDISTAVIMNGSILTFATEAEAIDMAESFTGSYGSSEQDGVTVRYCEKHDRYIIVMNGCSINCNCRKD